MVLVWVSKLTRFSCRGIEVDFILWSGSKLAWLQCRDRNWHGLCVGVEKDLVLACGSKFPCVLWGGNEIDLILERGSNRLYFSSGVELNSIFLWGTEIELVLVLGSKVTCFCPGDRNWPWVGRDQLVSSVMIDWLGFRMGVCHRYLLGFCGRAQIACFLRENRNWPGLFLGGRYWLDFSAGDRTWLDFGFGIGIDFGLCLGVKNDLVLVSRSKLTWISCDDGRPHIDMESWQIDVLVMFYKTTQSPLTEWLSDLSFTNEQKRRRHQLPGRADWVAQFVIRHKRTTEVWGSNPTEVVVQLFSEMPFSGIHLHITARPYAKPIKESVEILDIWC